MRHRDTADGGYVTPAFVAVVGLTMVLLVGVANALAVHYARGVMQAAVEEGARQGVAAGQVACTARVDSVLDAGLGAMADGVRAVDCAVAVDGGVATLSATFAPWLPGLPAHQVDVRARVAARPAGTP